MIQAPFFKPTGLENNPNTLRHHANDYLSVLLNRGLNHATIKNRFGFLKRFINWSEHRNRFYLPDITITQLQDYKMELIKSPGMKSVVLQSSTIHRHLVCLRAFFHWCTREGRLFDNPAIELTTGNPNEDKLAVCLTEKEMNRLLSHPDTQNLYGLRNRTIMEVLYSTDIRKNELIHLDFSDIDFSAEIVTIRHGKGNRQRLVPIGKRALDWIDTYLTRSESHTTGHSSPLFLTREKNRVGDGTIQMLFKSAKRDCGISKWGGAHLIRHTMATLMLKNGADLRIIQEILGHTRIDTTLIYTHLDITHLKEVHRKTHPAEQGISKGMLF